MGGRGASSKAKSNPEKVLINMSQKGIMPEYVMIGGTDEGYNQAYELINRYYGMPSTEYLSQEGVEIEDSYTPKRTRTGEYELRKRVAVRNTDGIRTHIHVISAPLKSTSEARRGNEKHTLYILLQKAGKLNKKEFLRR